MSLGAPNRAEQSAAQDDVGARGAPSAKTGTRGFSEDDQLLLSIVASQSAEVVENARPREQEQALIWMREELRWASEIRLALLPRAAPAHGHAIAGVSTPADVVGGDYFDFIAVDDAMLAVCLGDVSGKGLSAALLMASLQATIRARTLRRGRHGTCARRPRGDPEGAG